MSSSVWTLAFIVSRTYGERESVAVFAGRDARYGETRGVAPRRW